jgi:hypothetical protein
LKLFGRDQQDDLKPRYTLEHRVAKRACDSQDIVIPIILGTSRTPLSAYLDQQSQKPASYAVYAFSVAPPVECRPFVCFFVPRLRGRLVSTKLVDKWTTSPIKSDYIFSVSSCGDGRGSDTRPCFAFIGERYSMTGRTLVGVLIIAGLLISAGPIDLIAGGPPCRDLRMCGPSYLPPCTPPMPTKCRPVACGPGPVYPPPVCGPSYLPPCARPMPTKCRPVACAPGPVYPPPTCGPPPGYCGPGPYPPPCRPPSCEPGVLSKALDCVLDVTTKVVALPFRAIDCVAEKISCQAKRLCRRPVRRCLTPPPPCGPGPCAHVPACGPVPYAPVRLCGPVPGPYVGPPAYARPVRMAPPPRVRSVPIHRMRPFPESSASRSGHKLFADSVPGVFGNYW